MKNLIESFRTSLRFRMTAGMAVMLLPLLVLGIGNILSAQRVTQALDAVARTEREALRPLTDLQKLVLESAGPPSDYLILGSRAEATLFEFLARQTDEAFTALMASSAFAGKQPRMLLDEAYAEWSQARAVGTAIHSIPRPVGNAAAGVRMKVFDAHIGRTTEILDSLYRHIQSTIERQRTAAGALQQRTTVFLAVIFLSAMGIAIAAGYLLSRSFVLPVRVLQDGSFEFSQGGHLFREALRGGDAIVSLEQALNTNALRLEYDGLTGAYTRQEFERRFKNEMRRSARYGHSFTLLVVDIDRLMLMNDAHGHAAGDDVLRIVTARLLEEVRSADTIARYSGEEFAVIMPETGAEGAHLVAERLRSAIAAEPVTASRGGSLPVTVSIGSATFPRDGRAGNELVAAAYAALFAAKAAGRNRVISYESSLAPAAPPCEPASS